MRRLLIVLALLCVPALALAQVYPANSYPGGPTDDPLVGLRAKFTAFTDFTTGVLNSVGGGTPYQCGAIGTGTLAYTTTIVGRPGIAALSSSASANTGFFCGVGLFNSFAVTGGEHFEIAWAPSRFTDVVFSAGLGDTVNTTAIVDGVYLTVGATGLVSGVAVQNSTPTSTVTSYQLTLGGWYRGVVNILSTSLATFTVYDAANVAVWSDTVASNIPTGSARGTGAGFWIYHTGSSALELAQVDWISYSSASLTR